MAAAGRIMYAGALTLEGMDVIISKINKRKRRTHEKADERSAGRRSWRQSGVFLLAGLDARCWYAPIQVESGRLTGPVRLAVLTDLHACAYGEGQRELLDAVAEQSPDLVLLCGDIVDDEPRMPEARALDTVEALAAVMAHLLCHRQSRVLGRGGWTR